MTNMEFHRFLIIFFFVKFVKNLTLYNPLLTYTMRYPKLRFYPNITGNYTINQYNQKEYFSGYYTINSPKLVKKAEITFNRCDPEGNNCEYFQSWKFSDVCPLLQQKNQIWSPLYDAYDPPMVCPIDKKYYQIHNASFKMEYALRWYPDIINYYWKITQKFYDNDDTYVGSYTIDTYVFSYRKRNTKTRPPKTTN